MDGSVIPLPGNDGDRRAPAPANGRLSGLPIFATEPLTAAEREALRRAARIARLIAESLDEAVDANRVSQALWAVTHSADAGQVLVDLAAQIGRNR